MIKTKTTAKIQPWTISLRNRVGDSVNYNGNTYVNISGRNSEPPNINDWTRIDASKTSDLINDGDDGLNGFLDGKDVFLEDKRFLFINHNNVISKSSNIVDGVCYGNSIMQGSGSGGIENTIPQRVANKLQSYKNQGSVNDWSPDNYGVGGCTTATVAQYVANLYKNDLFTLNNKIKEKRGAYALILTLRNDVSSGTSVDKMEQLLNIIFSTLKTNNVQPLLVVDPPQINFTTGEITDYTNGFLDIYNIAIQSAKSNGATIVDCWKMFEKRKNLGESLIQYMNDGTHPNASGYELISDLIFQALISADKTTKHEEFVSEHELVAVYDAWNPSQLTSTFTGLTTSSTSRKVELEEATNEAYNLADGEFIEFYNDSPCVGVIITAIGEPGGGTLTGTYGFVNLGLTMNTNKSAVREFSYYSKFSTAFAAYHKVGKLKLTSTGNTKITGVTFIDEKFINKQDFIYDYDTNTTLTTETLPNGNISQGLANVGNFFEFYIYGSFITFQYERGTSKGKFVYTFDGTPNVEVDCYLNAAPTQGSLTIDLGFEGWHKFKISNITANPSSSGTSVEFGFWKLFSKKTVSNKMFITTENNNKIDLRNIFEDVSVVKDYGGNSIVYKSLEGNEFIREGSGASLIEFNR